MGQSFSRVSGATLELDTDPASGHSFEAFGLQLVTEVRDGQVYHQAIHRDPSGRTVLEAEAPVQYAMGSGTRGKSYLFEKDGYLFQSPISWFTGKKDWDLSPHLDPQKPSQLFRPVEADCLFCHCNDATPVSHSVNHYRTPVFRDLSIGCERCHGPGELHVRQEEGDLVLPPGEKAIVNPRDLAPALRESVCQQCHLQGDVRIARRGREAFDFRPGLPFQLFFSVFIRPPELTKNNKAVSHVEQMSVSLCYLKSGGNLGCISCHDPHTLPAPEKRLAFYRSRCLNCHQEKDCSAAPDLRQAQNDSCIACHMPRADSSNVAHTAVTDHRIPRLPDTPREPIALAHQLLPDVPLMHFHDALRDPLDSEILRDLGLAMMQWVDPNKGPVANVKMSRAALPLLSDAVKKHPDDWPARVGQGQSLWLLGRKQEALDVFDAVLQECPEYELALMNAAIVAGELDRLEVALSYWARLAQVNPYSWTSHYQQAKLLEQRRDWPGALEECRAALRIDPIHPGTRRVLITCLLRTGKEEEAEAELRRALEGLNPEEQGQMRQWFREQAR
jgi:hypothetical protein